MTGIRDEFSWTDGPEQIAESLAEFARAGEDPGSQRDDSHRGVSELVADGNDDHDVHDLQDDSDSDDDSGTGGSDGSDSDSGEGSEDGGRREGLDDARSRFADERTGRTRQSAIPDLLLGVIGCGEIAQALHLPHISSFTGTTITAIADLSPERVERIGNQYGISHRYQQGSTLIAEHHVHLDGVVICTPPETHVDLAAQALAAGLATFVEAPLAVTPGDAWSLLRRVVQADVPAMVGYRGRYDPAYHQFSTELERSDTVRYVDAYDVKPVEPRVIRTGSDPVPGPIPEERATESDRIRTRQAKDAIGTDKDWIADEYLYHLEQLCHDVNLLRGLYGDVAEIQHASLDDRGEFLTAELGYEGGGGCHLTSGRTRGEWFEDYIRVDTADRMVRLDYSNPYRRNSPSEVTIKEGTNEVVTRSHVPTTDSPFKRELGAFVEAIRRGKPTRTPFTDAAKDVDLIAKLVSQGTAGTDVSH